MSVGKFVEFVGKVVEFVGKEYEVVEVVEKFVGDSI